MKTKLEIINETVEFYSKDPVGRRALENLTCTYLTKDGRMCAVGRCLIDPASMDTYKLPSDFKDFDTLLKPEYRGHTVKFWEDLQGFHDLPMSWIDTGLSLTGQGRLSKLKEKYV